jgi:type II secretion system protein C
MVTVRMLTVSILIKNVQEYLHNENRIVTICEVGLVIILAISLANLVTDIIQMSDAGSDPLASEFTFPGEINNIGNSGGLNRENGDRQPSIQLKGLFGAPTTSQQPTQANENEQLEETQLNLKLKGILVDSQSRRQLAVIASPNNAEEIYRVGDQIEGAELIRIETRRVVIRRNGINEALYLEIPKLESTKSVNPVTRSATFGKNGIQKLGENKRVVSQQSLRQQLNNLPRLLQQAKAVPHTVNGQNIGFIMTEIQAGSVFDDLGLQTEDIIRSVNGAPIRTAEDALNAYRKLRTAKSFQLDLMRSGHAMTLNLLVQ